MKRRYLITFEKVPPEAIMIDANSMIEAIDKAKEWWKAQHLFPDYNLEEVEE